MSGKIIDCISVKSLKMLYIKQNNEYYNKNDQTWKILSLRVNLKYHIMKLSNPP